MHVSTLLFGGVRLVDASLKRWDWKSWVWQAGNDRMDLRFSPPSINKPRFFLHHLTISDATSNHIFVTTSKVWKPKPTKNPEELPPHLCCWWDWLWQDRSLHLGICLWGPSLGESPPQWICFSGSNLNLLWISWPGDRKKKGGWRSLTAKGKKPGEKKRRVLPHIKKQVGSWGTSAYWWITSVKPT